MRTALFPASGVLPAAPGGRPVTWAATGRFAGVSREPYGTLNLATHVGDDLAAVAANLQLVEAAVGCRGLAITGSVHGADVAVVDGPGLITGFDGLVTSTRSLGLLALAADCATVGLVAAGRVSVVHCGWQGLVKDVVGAAVAALGGSVDHAVIGPAICGNCYPVPADRADAVRASAAYGDGVVVRRDDGQPGIDVGAGVVARLSRLGVDPSRIHRVAGCTAEDSTWFSFRRDGRTGRHGLVLVME